MARGKVGWIAAVVVGAGFVLGQVGSRAGQGDGGAGPGSLRALVHINFPEGGRHAQAMKNIARILEADPGAEVVVVCHSGGIGLVESARTEQAEAIADLIARGARFVACENTMSRNRIAPEDLVPGVGTVPSGAVEVVRRQQFDGFAYFRP
jgi:intracellular sulfur oxidation DsrE/DsrF family protein